MCGIAGIINLNKAPVDREILRAMTDALSHRGPDGEGMYLDGFVGFGHRRLAIIDLSENARQPMLTIDKNFAITYNGEMYNFKELKNELKGVGVRFRSHSDAEVVLNAFSKWGLKSLDRFNGMFAFGFWDKTKNILTLVRDRYGIKPIYYWQNGKVFLFASEIKAFLRHPLFEAEVDPEVLLEYFTFQNTFTYKTLFKGVKLLPPGHFMRIFTGSDMKIETKQYWDFNFTESTPAGSQEEYTEELDRLFRQAVQRQLVSDVEIGSFSSGGIDSSSIVAVASGWLDKLKTFCIGFDMSSASSLEFSFDERKKAERISRLYRTEHHQMVLKAGDMQKCLSSLVWALEDLRLGQSYPNFYASKLAASYVKVCLSGAGGDELFAGYPWRYYRQLNSKNFDEYIDGYYKYWQRLIPNKVLNELFAPVRTKVSHVWTEDIFRSVLIDHEVTPETPQEYINRSLYFEAKTFLHGLFIVEDKLSMAHGLEVRVPFLDNDLVDFASEVPIGLKLKNINNIMSIDEDELAKREKYFGKMHDGKMILRKALAKYAGDHIINQHKQGFSGPDASWFKGESVNYIKETLLDSQAGIYNYFDPKVVHALIDEHMEGKHNRRLFIWSLLCFELWLKLFMSKEEESCRREVSAIGN